MTGFEELAKELIGKVETDENGFYKGHTRALALMTNKVILSDDEEVFNLDWEDQKELIKAKFYRTFPYLKK